MNVSSLLLKLSDVRVRSDPVWVQCREYWTGAGSPWGRMAHRVTPLLCSLASAFPVTDTSDRETHRPSRLPPPGSTVNGEQANTSGLSILLWSPQG